MAVLVGLIHIVIVKLVKVPKWTVELVVVKQFSAAEA